MDIIFKERIIHMAQSKKKTSAPVVDIITVSEINYVLSGVDINIDGMVDRADV